MNKGEDMIIIQIFVLLIGLSIGSFLNVCIYRIPEKKSISVPPSHCPKCKHNLNVIDLIPVLGYLINRGRCRYCEEKIPVQYPLIEILTAIVFLFLFNKFGLSIHFIQYAVLTSILIVVTFIDLRTQEIPDELIIFGLIAGLLFNIYDIKYNMINGILGFLLGGGIFLLIAMVTNGAMGGGDIKLMGVLGLFLGWKQILLISLIAFVLGALVSIVLIATKLKNRKDYIPFGPFIAIAALTVVCYGERLITLYINSTIK